MTAGELTSVYGGITINAYMTAGELTSVYGGLHDCG